MSLQFCFRVTPQAVAQVAPESDAVSRGFLFASESAASKVNA